MISKPALIAAALLAAAVPAGARPAPGLMQQSPVHLSLGYDGRLDGLKVLDMQFEQKVVGGDFNAGAHLRSYGLLAAFRHFDVKANANGHIGAAGVVSDEFDYDNQDGKRERHIRVNWRRDDVVSTSQPAFANMGDPPATRDQRLAAADPLTQLMRVTLAVPARPCEGAARLYDGKQLYALEFAPGHAETPDDDQRAMGVTQMLRCQVRYVEIAGFKKRPPGKHDGGLKGPISVAFGQMGADGPWVMADIRADTPIGPADIRLRHTRLVRGLG